MSAAAAVATRPRRARLSTLAVTATAGLPLISVSAPNVALPAIAGGLGARFDELQWVVAAYALALASLQLVAGPLADRYGRRRATVGGLALFAAGGCVAAVAPGIGMLIAGRALEGVGGAFVLTGALGLVAVQFPSGDRLKVLALRSAIIATAFAIGPLAGGVLTEALGWRAVFAFDAALALPLLAILAGGDGDPVGPGRAAVLDWPGLAALTVTLVAIVFTIIRGNDAGWTSAPILASGAAGLAGAAVVAVRQRAGHHLLPPELLRSRALAASVLSLLALYVSVFGGFVYITLYLRTVCGLSPAATGGLLVVFAAASLATVLAVTRSSRRERLELLIPLALGVAAAGLLWIAAAAGGSPWSLTPGLALLGVAAGVVNPLLTANQIGAFKPQDGGVAAGLNGASRQFGTALGTALLGALVQAAIERHVSAAGPVGGASVQRVAAGDLSGGLAGADARVHEAVDAAYRAGVTGGLRLAMVAGAILLVLVAPLAARWLRGS